MLFFNSNFSFGFGFSFSFGFGLIVRVMSGSAVALVLWIINWIFGYASLSARILGCLVKNRARFLGFCITGFCGLKGIICSTLISSYALALVTIHANSDT